MSPSNTRVQPITVRLLTLIILLYAMFACVRGAIADGQDQRPNTSFGRAWRIVTGLGRLVAAQLVHAAGTVNTSRAHAYWERRNRHPTSYCMACACCGRIRNERPRRHM